MLGTGVGLCIYIEREREKGADTYPVRLDLSSGSCTVERKKEINWKNIQVASGFVARCAAVHFSRRGCKYMARLCLSFFFFLKEQFA